MKRTTLALVAAGLVTAAAGPAAQASTPTEMVAALNKQRAANGLANVTLSPHLSEGCSKHVLYMEQNDFGHGEEEGRPGYTDAGAGRGVYAFEAENILYGPFTWTARDNPFARMSYHVRGHFDPRLSEVGYAESATYSCVRFRFGHDEQRGYSFAADPRGPRAVYTGGVLGDGESEDIGKPRGTKTGPALLLYHLGKGEGLEPVSYSLRGPRKKVKVSLLGDELTQRHHLVSTMLPHKPLSPRTKYRGQVRWRLADGTIETQRFSFRTTGLPNFILAEPVNGTLYVSSLARNISTVMRNGEQKIRRKKRARRRGAFQHEGRRLWDVAFAVRQAVGETWETCVSSGGRGTPYERMVTCGALPF